METRSRTWVVALACAVLIGTSPLPHLDAAGRGGGGGGGGGSFQGGGGRGGGGNFAGGMRGAGGGGGRSFGGGAPRVHNGQAGGGSAPRISSGNFGGRGNSAGIARSRPGNIGNGNPFRAPNLNGGSARQFSARVPSSSGKSSVPAKSFVNRGFSQKMAVQNPARSSGIGKNASPVQRLNSSVARKATPLQNAARGSSRGIATLSKSTFSQRHAPGISSRTGSSQLRNLAVKGSSRLSTLNNLNLGRVGRTNSNSSFTSRVGQSNFGRNTLNSANNRSLGNLAYRRGTSQSLINRSNLANRSNNLTVNARNYVHASGRSFRNSLVSFGRNNALQYSRQNLRGGSFSQTLARNSARVAGNRLAWGVGSRVVPYGGFGRFARIGMNFGRPWGGANAGWNMAGWRNSSWGYGGWRNFSRSPYWNARNWGINRWSNGWGWQASRWAFRHPWKANFLNVSGFYGGNARWAWRHPRLSGFYHSGWRAARWAFRHPWRSSYAGLGWRFSRWAWRHPIRASWLAWGNPGWGYPGWGRYGYGNNFVNIGLGFGGGYGGGGYYGGGSGGGYGGGGYGCSYAYNPSCTTGGYSDYGYAPVSYSLASLDGTALPAGVAPVTDAAEVLPTLPSTDANPPAGTAPSAYAELGENEFKAGNYDKAATAWRHAIVEEPKNGILLMMLSQALFATGKFDEAAGSLQQGMLLLPEEAWGVVPQNYKDLYGKTGDYSQQLKALEAARKAKPDEPGLRFLLGYHYGYLGYAAEAVKELDHGLKLVPQDELAEKMRAAFRQKATPTGEATPKPVPQKSAS